MNRLLQDKKSGWKLVKAESLKRRHTFERILPVAAPLFTILLAFLLTGGSAHRSVELVVYAAAAGNACYSVLSRCQER